MKLINFLMLSVLAMTNCGGEPNLKYNEITFPEGLKEVSENGAFEVHYDAKVSSARGFLKEKYGKMESNADKNILFVSDKTDWQKIIDHYNQKLTEKGYQRNVSIAEKHIGYQLVVWERKGLSDTKAFAVMMTEDSSNTPSLKMLALFSKEQ